MLLAACSFFGDAGPGPGDPFALASLPALAEGGGRVDFAGGKPLLVNVWATWCGPCRREMPGLAALDRIAPGGVRVVGISVDGDRNLALEFVRRERLPFANAHDPDGRRVREALGVSRFPATFLVDAQGIVRMRVESARDWSSPEALERIARVLREAA